MTGHNIRFSCGINKNYPLLSPNTPSYLELCKLVHFFLKEHAEGCKNCKLSFIFELSTCIKLVEFLARLYETTLMRGHSICIYVKKMDSYLRQIFCAK